MKTKIRLSFCVFLCLLLVLTTCKGKPEHDAAQLADLHHQKVNLIMMMLQTNDSAALRHYQEKLLLLESEYSDLKIEFEKKYADSISKKQFEAAFKKALKRDAK